MTGSSVPAPTAASVIEGRRPGWYARPWVRPVIGIVLLAVIVLAAPVYGRLTAGGKISPDVPRDTETVSVIVDLTVDVSTFHREELSELGVFSGRDRKNPTDRSRVRLQNVSQDALEKLTRFYWVESIEPA